MSEKAKSSEEETLEMSWVPEGTSPSARVVAEAIYALAREMRKVREVGYMLCDRLLDIRGGHE